MGLQTFCMIILSVVHGLSVYSALSSDVVTIEDIGFKNVRCLGVIIKVIKNFGFLMCARECEQTEMCTGFNFGSSQLLCELLNSTMKTEKETGWRFVDVLTWLQKKGVSKVSHNKTCSSEEKNIKLSSKEVYCQSYGYFPIDCADIVTTLGESKNGVYRIEPSRNNVMDVYCDVEEGNWTVFQRRKDGSVGFYRIWDEYKNGFGDVTGNFWVGNDKLHNILSAHEYKLRIDMEYFNGEQMFAEYSLFRVAGEDQHYRLTVGNYSGNAGDAFTFSNNMGFSTKDRDNDNDATVFCAQKFIGGWWYNNCHKCNLNGKYFKSGNCPFGVGINWSPYDKSGFTISLKSVVMKIKRLELN